MTWMQNANRRAPVWGVRLRIVGVVILGCGTVMSLVQLLGWRPVAAPMAWWLTLLGMSLVVLTSGRIAIGVGRTVLASSSVGILAFGAVQLSNRAGSPLAMIGGFPPMPIAIAQAAAWAMVMFACAGVAIRGGLGPVRTAFLTALGVVLWAIPAGEAFGSISTLVPSALSAESIGWGRPSGLAVLLVTPVLATVGWLITRPHHPALAATRHPEMILVSQTLLVTVAALRYGRTSVAVIGGVSLIAFLALPAVIRNQGRRASIERKHLGI
jgi:hypothetical protein